MNSYILQLVRIIPYWIAGITLGSFLSISPRININRMLLGIASWKHLLPQIITASVLGALSPVTLFGVIPVLNVINIDNKKIESVLISFITSSILISPNIFIFTMSLGLYIAVARLLFSIFAGIIIGLITGVFPEDRESFMKLNRNHDERQTESVTKNKELRKAEMFASAFLSAFKKTGINLLIGMLISLGLFFLIPDSLWEITFSDIHLAVPLSAVLSVGLYQCGGGSIPILRALMMEGLPAGAVMTFMMVGPLTKMTNLSALKCIMSFKKLIIYCSILVLYMLLIGWSLEIYT